MIIKNPIIIPGQSNDLNIHFSSTPPKDKQKIWLRDYLPSDIHISFSVRSESDYTNLGSFPYEYEKFSAARYNDYIYFFGGLIAGNLTRDVIKYNIRTNTFNIIENVLPYPLCGAGCVVNGFNIYIIGGYSAANTMGSIYDSVMIFNTITNEITSVSNNLPKKLANVSCAIIENKIYVMGGVYSPLSPYATLIPNKNIYVLNTYNNDVDIISNVFTSAINPGLAVYDNKIYILGNKKDGKSIISVFNPSTNEVTDILTLKKPYNGAYSFAINDNYVFMWHKGIIQRYDFIKNKIVIIRDLSVYNNSDGAVTFYNNNTLIMVYDSSAYNVWSFNIYDSLPEGEYFIKISAYQNGTNTTIFSVNGFEVKVGIDAIYKGKADGSFERISYYKYTSNNSWNIVT